MVAVDRMTKSNRSRQPFQGRLSTRFICSESTQLIVVQRVSSKVLLRQFGLIWAVPGSPLFPYCSRFHVHLATTGGNRSHGRLRDLPPLVLTPRSRVERIQST